MTSSDSCASSRKSVSPAFTVWPTLTSTLAILRVWLMVTSYVSFAPTVPEPRILALIVPPSICCAATSGSVAFMIVLEKKVRTSRIARKMIAAVLTHSRLLTFVSSMVNILSRCG